MRISHAKLAEMSPRPDAHACTRARHDVTQGNGVIDKKEFVDAMHGLGAHHHSDEQLEQVFGKWDLDGNGTLDFKEFDRAIRGAKGSGSGGGAGSGGSAMQAARRATVAVVTAKEIGQAIDERLAGRRSPTTREGGGFKRSDTRGKGAAAGTARVPTAVARHKSGTARGKKAAAAVDEQAAEGSEQRWNAAQWLQSLALHDVVAASLELPDPGPKQFRYVRTLEREHLESLLAAADLVSGICDVVMEGVAAFSGGGANGAQNGAVANDKFQTNAKFQVRHMPHLEPGTYVERAQILHASVQSTRAERGEWLKDTEDVMRTSV